MTSSGVANRWATGSSSPAAETPPPELVVFDVDRWAPPGTEGDPCRETRGRTRRGVPRGPRGWQPGVWQSNEEKSSRLIAAQHFSLKYIMVATVESSRGAIDYGFRISRWQSSKHLSPRLCALAAEAVAKISAGLAIRP
jgi:hypothetical protein